MSVSFERMGMSVARNMFGLFAKTISRAATGKSTFIGA